MKKKPLLFIILAAAVLAGSWFLFGQKPRTISEQINSSLVLDNDSGSDNEVQQEQEQEQEQIEILVKEPEIKQGEGDELIVTIPNAAADYCRYQGYDYRSAVTEDGTLYGVCLFGETACPGWEYLQDKCQPGERPIKYISQ